MIARNMQQYEIYEIGEGFDEWGNVENVERKIGVCEMSISSLAGTNIAVDVKYSEVSHIGLTKCNTLLKDNILIAKDKRYIVEKPPTDTTRYTQVFLKEVI